MRRWFLLVGSLAGFWSVTGCSKGPDLVPVSGRVTLEGKPVTQVTVNFQPTGRTQGNGSLGTTDPEGRFTLTDARGKPGTYVGEYKVIFYPALAPGIKEGDPADVVGAAFGKSLPSIYFEVGLTPLTANVPQTGGTVEIMLTKSGKGAATKTTPNFAGQ